MEAVEDDRQLRAMVALIESQAEQVTTLRATVDRVERRLATARTGRRCRE